MDLENQSREQLLTRIRELEERLAGSGPSERRHAEAQQAQLRRALEEKNAELEARHAEMESFTYAISHDLKAPLITISGFLAEIESAALSGNVERLKADLERIGAAAERMRGMVDEILMLSRAGQMISTLDEVSLTQVAREAVRLVSGQLERAGVEVTIHEPLPKIIGDKARLLQVMQNLVDNGVKFLGDQPHPKIEIGGSESPDRVGIYVADNGIGIAPKDQQRAFQLFQRLDRKVEGTGFGLALVKKIVEAHRGRVWIESEGRNQGPRVCFSLPKIGKIAEMLREASG
jgi:signal transduction histidine kinase